MFISILAYGGAEVWTEAVILATIFNLAAGLFFRGQESVESEINKLLAPILAFALYSFLQGFLTLLDPGGISKLAAFLPYSFDLTASFWNAAKFLALALFIKVLVVNFRTNMSLLILSLIIIGNFFAVLGIVRFWLQAGFHETFGWFILPGLRPGVGFGTFLNQNHFAFLMLMTLGLNLGVCAYGKLAKNIRFVLLLFSLLVWIAIILTASRGGIISSFLVIAFSVFLPRAEPFRRNSNYLNNKRRSKTFSLGKTVTGLLALAILAVVGIVLIGQERVVQRFEEIPAQFKTDVQSDAFLRLDVWRASLAMFEDHLFFGVGFGGFRYAVSPYIKISGEVVPQQAHNDYLELAASGGAIGIFCGLWFIYNLFLVLKKRLAVPTDSFEYAVRFGAIGAFAGILVHNFFDFGLQYIANWLFLAALLGIAVHNENGISKATDRDSTVVSKYKFVGWRFFAAACLLILSFLCLFFGFSRFENSLARNNPDYSDIVTNIFQLPFDADFYESRAQVAKTAGNFEIESENLKQAIRYRPKDYVLWLKFGKNRQLQNHIETAETAFRKALDLAPFYGEPYFDYGNFLIDSNRKAEGFEQLHTAFRRNPAYFNEVFARVWKESGANAEQTIRLMMPLDLPEKEKLAELLLDKTAYASVPQITCHEEDVTPMKRHELIVKLLEKRRLFYAYQIYTRNCQPLSFAENNLIDGDFESDQLEKGIGFGWRLGDLQETVRIGFDNQIYLSGSQSLGLIFNGIYESSLTLIRQVMVIEKNHSYQLTFAYRTEKITSGSLPVLQLILKQNDNDVLVKEIKLGENSGDWIKISVPIETNNQAEALEIRLTRQNCRENLCPVYGRMWLDNFILKSNGQ